ncbi:unnamed protein product [Clonostachys byssicola]|uniref:Uncharacterized protein n=1 Tax=Clonostachys byssicola TaxID=160290 RepID=A0A9N9Y3U9_9HYPO|nr:unnamed protein product [Clonostachys byssicola]
MPWLVPNIRSLERIAPSQQTGGELLRYWVESASYIMALDPENNPLSFPVLKYYNQSPSLIHALQSISAGHQYFFEPGKLRRCFEERLLSIQHVRKELDTQTNDPSLAFLTVFVLGLSSYWIALPADDPVLLHHAQAHLQGGRALIDTMLAIPVPQFSPQMLFAFGAYLYWDMACSFVIAPADLKAIDGSDFSFAVEALARMYHPILGYSAEITYVLAKVGRYCRTVEDTEQRDTSLEEELENQLRSIKPTQISAELGLLEEAYRCHGLINIYAIYRRGRVSTASPEAAPSHSTEEQSMADLPAREPSDSWELDETGLAFLEKGFYNAFDEDMAKQTLKWLDYLPLGDYQPLMLPSDEHHSSSESLLSDGDCDTSTETISDDDLQSTIRKLAIQAVHALTQVPESHPSINLHGIPLLTAGSELLAADVEERKLVTKRFRALYSFNHMTANLTALDLLQEVWAIRDLGGATSWLKVMRSKGWHLMLG